MTKTLQLYYGGMKYVEGINPDSRRQYNPLLPIETSFLGPENEIMTVSPGSRFLGEEDKPAILFRQMGPLYSVKIVGLFDINKCLSILRKRGLVETVNHPCSMKSCRNLHPKEKKNGRKTRGTRVQTQVICMPTGITTSGNHRFALIRPGKPGFTTITDTPEDPLLSQRERYLAQLRENSLRPEDINLQTLGPEIASLVYMKVPETLTPVVNIISENIQETKILPDGFFPEEAFFDEP